MMTKKKKWISIAIVAILLIVLWVIFMIYVMGAVRFSQSVEHSEDVYIDVPDSDLTVVAKHGQWLDSWVDFYYVDENGEHVRLPYVVFRASYNPFATGDYEVINNQDGTFTIRWSNHNNPIPPKNTWGEVTYDFPS